MTHVWELYPGLVEVVRRSHEEYTMVGHGHDVYHALRVAEVCLKIAEDEETGRMAAIAALCHNADRLLQVQSGEEASNRPPEWEAEQVRALVEGWLDEAGGRFADFRMSDSDHDRRVVIHAVLNHSNRNGDDDHPVLVTLMDADRIVNLDLDVVIRAGQLFHHLSAVDFHHFLGDPEATYRNPRSVLRDIAYCFDWAEEGSPVSVRLPKAKAMAAERAAHLQKFFDVLKEQLESEGVVPDPLS